MAMSEKQRQEVIRAVQANIPLRGSRASTEKISAKEMVRNVRPRGRRGTGALRGSMK